MTERELIEVFEDTRKSSIIAFGDDTEQLVNNTEVIEEPLEFECEPNRDDCGIGVIESDTISAIIKYSSLGYNVCALNFADGMQPGGLVRYGARTQEECICRCSNLYQSLDSDESLNKYYNYNRSIYSSRGMTFSDRIIYSPRVTVFKDAQYNIINSVHCDILSCPAPVNKNQENYYKIVENRIRGMLKVMSYKSNDVIILGAWGCGAYGGNPTTVGSAFAKVLSEIHSFKKVVFAIPRNGDNLYKFREVFKKVLEEDLKD